MALPMTEFIFLPAIASVLPEKEASVHDNTLLQFLSTQKQLYSSIIWGRGIDRPDIICIGIRMLQLLSP